MATPTRREFPALLAGLDAPGYARLLAALGRARGEDASVRGGTVVVTGGRRIQTYVPPRWLPARVAAGLVARRDGVGEGGAADAVATTDPAVAALLRERGVTVVGPEQVRQALLYDLDRATADALCREHLGRPLDTDPRRGVGERVVGAVPVPLAVVIVVALLVTVTFAVPLDLLDTDELGDDPMVADGPVTEAATPTEEPSARELVPGIDEDGVENADELRRAHESAVSGRSYTWRLTYHEYPLSGGQVAMTERVRTVRVENRTTFHETTTGMGEISTPFVRIPRREVYADGRTRYVRRDTDGSTTRTTANDTTANDTTAVTRNGTVDGDTATVYAGEAGRYVHRFVSGTPGNAHPVVENGTTQYRVIVHGTSHPDMNAYSAVALVTRSGFVRELRVSYTYPELGRRGIAIELTFRYTRVGETTVDAPGWYEQARNRTATNPEREAEVSGGD